MRKIGANDLLKKLDCHDRIPDIEALVREDGFALNLLPTYSSADSSFLSKEQLKFFDSVRAALIVQCLDLDKEIFYHENLSDYGKRFLIAYLFSYYQLKKDSRSSFHEFVYEDTYYDRASYQLAIDLLVPDDLFEKEEEISPFLLAPKYQVSPEIIKRKIRKKGR